MELEGALGELRPLLLDPDRLVRAVAAGRQRAHTPRWRRAELRPVDLKDGRHLQVVTYDERRATTTNPSYGGDAEAEVDALLAVPFGNWHVQTTTETLQLRITKKGKALLHRRADGAEQRTAHDRASAHLIDPGDPLFKVLGAGASKRRQVDAFLRVLQAAVADAELPTDRPLRVVDLGCGNAYLTFAAYRFLADGRDVRLTGVDQRPEMRARNTEIAAELGWADAVDFVAGNIIDAPVVPPVDIVLALHACDTATDDALAQAVRWSAPVVLAAPCCHHDLQRQMSASRAPSPYGVVARHAILRERLGDVLTDSLRAALLRKVGYRVEVMAFVSAEYTPRNTMIRAVSERRASREAYERTEGAVNERRGHDGAVADGTVDGEYDELVAAWGVTPYLQTLLDDRVAGRD